MKIIETIRNYEQRIYDLYMWIKKKQYNIKDIRFYIKTLKNEYKDFLKDVKIKIKNMNKEEKKMFKEKLKNIKDEFKKLRLENILNKKYNKVNIDMPEIENIKEVENDIKQEQAKQGKLFTYFKNNNGKVEKIKIPDLSKNGLKSFDYRPPLTTRKKEEIKKKLNVRINNLNKKLDKVKDEEEKEKLNNKKRELIKRENDL